MLTKRSALGYTDQYDHPWTIGSWEAWKECHERELQEKDMATLKHFFDAIHESVETSSAAEIKAACELIIEVQNMDSGERDCLYAAYRNGPLFDGDVPSKAGRNSLMENGYIEKVVVKGEDGFNACTHKGAWAYLLLEAGA